MRRIQGDVGRPGATVVAAHAGKQHDVLDRLQQRANSGGAQLRRVPVPTPLAPKGSLFLGLISGDVRRRRIIRCTWGRALSALGPAVTLKFFVGLDQPDRGRSDVHEVSVAERVPVLDLGAARGSPFGLAAFRQAKAATRASKASPRSKSRGSVKDALWRSASIKGASSWTQYAKVAS